MQKYLMDYTGYKELTQIPLSYQEWLEREVEFQRQQKRVAMNDALKSRNRINDLLKENERLQGLLEQKLMIRDGEIVKHCGHYNTQEGDVWYMEITHQGKAKPNIFDDEEVDYIE